MQEKTEIEALNRILRGEHMAIDLYGTCSKETEDAEVKQALADFQRDHQQHAAELSERIRELGGTPQESRGMAGAIAQMGMRASLLLGQDDNSTLKHLYDGEDQGIARTEQVSGEMLDNRSQALVEGILSDDHDHLRRLEQLIAESGDDVSTES